MTPSSPRAPRRTYLDVLRGVAVLVMIEAHVIDSWTRTADRMRDAFGYSLILGGFGAPLFLFLAGVAIPMSAGSKARRLCDDAAAARAVERRGLEIFLLAFLFRFQAFVLGWGKAATLLRVDILNIMGPSIIATAWLWGRLRTPRARAAAFAVAAAVVALATPAVRAASALGILPDAVEAYLRPTGGLSNFVVFPWSAFVPAGAILGTWIDGSRTAPSELRLNLSFLAGGLLLAGISFALSYLPPVVGASYFWTSSPAFFFLRTGIMCAAVGVAYLWERRPKGTGWSPLQSLGRHSLFIYWIHVEMVYGVISHPLHQSLSLSGAWGALGLFVLFMVGCAALKDWWPTNVPRQGRRQPATLEMSKNFS